MYPLKKTLHVSKFRNSFSDRDACAEVAHPMRGYEIGTGIRDTFIHQRMAGDWRYCLDGTLGTRRNVRNGLSLNVGRTRA
jgi:hypothetical protein